MAPPTATTTTPAPVEAGVPTPAQTVADGAVFPVAGPHNFADDLLRRAGASNAVTDGGSWPTLGFERVVELEPSVVKLDLALIRGVDAAETPPQRALPELPGSIP